MNLQQMKCPNCNAPFSIDTEKSSIFFCPYCGSKIVLNKNSNCFEVTYNQTTRNIDDAQIRRVDAEKEIELKKLEIDLKKSKQRYFTVAAFAVVASVLICLFAIPKRTPTATPVAAASSDSMFQSSSNMPTSIEETHQVSSQSTSQNETYAAPTNTELSYGFLDRSFFTEGWEYGTYRCGTDFPAGDYFILSIADAAAMYDVSDDPNNFTGTTNQMLRKITVTNGQYVKILHGGIMVHADEIDTSNWEKYGIFLVGKDLPEGEYKITTLSNYCASINTQGVRGAYQICEDSPENPPASCNMLFENQAYITLKNGQYLAINNAVLTLCDG